MTILSASFRTVASEGDLAELPRLARKAAAQLSAWTGLPSKVTATSAGNALVAAVTFEGYRAGIAVGVYSDRVEVDAFADADWLVDQSLATEGDFGTEYASEGAPSVEDAIAWLKENCLREPIPRVTEEDLKEWERETVTIPKGIVSVLRAARIYGPVYGTNMDRLVRMQEVSREDAEKITAAVKKILPRRKE